MYDLKKAYIPGLLQRFTSPIAGLVASREEYNPLFRSITEARPNAGSQGRYPIIFRQKGDFFGSNPRCSCINR